jgi:hypothetical protein
MTNRHPGRRSAIRRTREREAHNQGCDNKKSDIRRATADHSGGRAAVHERLKPLLHKGDDVGTGFA